MSYRLSWHCSTKTWTIRKNCAKSPLQPATSQGGPEPRSHSALNWMLIAMLQLKDEGRNYIHITTVKRMLIIRHEKCFFFFLHDLILVSLLSKRVCRSPEITVSSHCHAEPRLQILNYAARIRWLPAANRVSRRHGGLWSRKSNYLCIYISHIVITSLIVPPLSPPFPPPLLP